MEISQALKYSLTGFNGVIKTKDVETFISEYSTAKKAKINKGKNKELLQEFDKNIELVKDFLKKEIFKPKIKKNIRSKVGQYAEFTRLTVPLNVKVMFYRDKDGTSKMTVIED